VRVIGVLGDVGCFKADQSMKRGSGSNEWKCGSENSSRSLTMSRNIDGKEAGIYEVKVCDEGK
jgi:hypothetical protein